METTTHNKSDVHITLQSDASKTQNLSQILATLSNPAVRTESDVQKPGVEILVDLLGTDAAAAEQAASSDLFSDVEILLMHATGSTDDGLKRAGESAFAIVRAVKRVQSSGTLSALIAAMNEV